MRRFLPLLFVLAFASPLAPAQKSASESESGATARAARAFDAAKKQGPLALRDFLVDMPKGADLHVHLSGAVYAESFLRAAGEDGLCVDTKLLSFAKAPSGGCPHVPDQVSVADMLAHMQVPANQDLYDKLIDAFSMRAYVPYAGWSGHDQFFSTFGHFGGTDKRHTGEWVDEVATRAAAQNEQYMELMETPPFGHAATIAAQLGWEENLAEFRQKLLDHGLDQEVDAAKEHIHAALELRSKLEKCGGTDAMPACQVKVRFIYQVLRGFPKEQVFAQTLLGFETISQMPEFVGINFVQPEDGYLSMADYTLQMHMLEYLHSVYPAVHISLHAGELAPGMVPPQGLRFHIRQAVEIGHAERIGHGVDVMYEDNAPALLKELAAKHVMVEINLTSNDGILGIKGPDHPLPFYRKAGVPVALSTDDEGVSRIDLTHEYVRAAQDFNLSYSDLKQMARTGMEHNFLPGKSLWAEEDRFTAPAAACRGMVLGSEKPAAACKAFLDANEKAAAQWEQERRFREFEAKW
ncbi:MAG TPA: adenosine deaminase [Acidobacteriaceae bacterium]|jgi:adenosine deaminase|nr:adenosine deaminase [Acidobacteriaceae bacterium]